MIGLQPEASPYLVGALAMAGYMLISLVRPFLGLLGSCRRSPLCFRFLTSCLWQHLSLGGYRCLIRSWVGVRACPAQVSKTGRQGACGHSVDCWQLCRSAQYSTWTGLDDLTPFLTYVQLFSLTFLVVNLARSEARQRMLGSVIEFTSVLIAAAVIVSHVGVLSGRLLSQGVSSRIMVSGRYIDLARATGPFADPNFTAVQLLTGLPFALEFLRGRNWPHRLVSIFSIFIIVLALYYTFSVGGLIGFATVVLLETVSDAAIPAIHAGAKNNDFGALVRPTHVLLATSSVLGSYPRKPRADSLCVCTWKPASIH